MKLVCANDFYNTPALGIKFSDADKKDELFQHENHVHVGHRFSIGGDAPYDQLQPQQKEHVGLLLKHKLAVIADDEANIRLGVIAKIDATAAAGLKVRKADIQAAKNAAAVSMPAVLKQLADVIALLAAKKA